MILAECRQAPNTNSTVVIVEPVRGPGVRTGQVLVSRSHDVRFLSHLQALAARAADGSATAVRVGGHPV